MAANETEVLIITDSIGRGCEPPKHIGKIQVFPGTVVQRISYDIATGGIVIPKTTKLFIILAGTNDIDNGNERIIPIVMSDIASALRRKIPDIRIVICGILPRPRDFHRTNETVKKVNKELNSWCNSLGYLHFCATFQPFLSRNRPNQTLFRDGLHLSKKGSTKLSQIFKNQTALWRQGRLTFW